MQNREEEFKRISSAVMKVYHEELHSFLNNNPQGTITDADVIIMIMNLTINVSTNVYYSIKQILPTTQLDYDFMRAKVINALVDSFIKIKDFNPRESTMPLTVDQIKEIYENGFCMVTLADGTSRRISKEDVLVKKEDVEKLIDEKKKEKADASTPKIITSSNGLLRG